MHHTEFTIKPNSLIIPLPSTASMYFIVHATSASSYRIDVLCQTYIRSTFRKSNKAGWKMRCE